VARLTWGSVGERFFEAGVDRGVLYVGAQPGVVWNGLISVSETPSGGEAQAYYIDGVKYLNVADPTEFEGTLEAFTYPDQFDVCQGTVVALSGLMVTNQGQLAFGLSYRTLIGNDLEGIDKGYKIHLVYNALAEPTARQGSTMDDSPNPENFSWKITALPPTFTGYRNTAHFIIDSRSTDPLALTAIENVLYGTESLTARLPLPDELFDIFATNSSFVVVDNGDGTWTATGTDFEVHMTGPTTFQIDTPAAVFIDADTYTLTSS
jgi:hypothetical protein